MFPFLLNMSMIGGSLTLGMPKAEKAICAVSCGEGLEPSRMQRRRIDGYVVRITRR